MHEQQSVRGGGRSLMIEKKKEWSYASMESPVAHPRTDPPDGNQRMRYEQAILKIIAI